MFGLSDDQARTGLGAMKAVAVAHGQFTDEERQLVAACARTLAIDVDIDALPLATPEQVAARFTDDVWRRRLIQALIATAMIDGEATADEGALIDRYAAALAIDEPWLKSLHRLIDGHVMRLRIDIFRRVPVSRKLFGDTYHEEGLRGVWRLMKVMRKQGELDHDLAWRFKQLGMLPQGTFGRGYWEYATSRKFPFPGEPGGFALRAIHHDLTHVLTGYGTDPSGETQIAAFTAGFLREDPFAMIFLTMVILHIGFELNPGVVEPARMQFDSDQCMRALQRGAAVNRDLTDHWDFWPDFPLPLDEVCRKYNVLPM